MDILWSALAGAAVAVISYLLVEAIFGKKLKNQIKSLIAGVLFIIALSVALSFPNPFLSHYDQKSEELGEKIMAIPQFQQQYGNISDQDVLKTDIADLVKKGLPYLDDNTLESRIPLLQELTSNADDQTCAAISKGNNLTLEENAVKTLNDQSLDEWLNINYEAIKASFESTSPAKITDDQGQKSLTNILNNLPKTDNDRIMKIFANWNTANDSDVCWAERTLEKSINEATEPDKKILSRYIVQ